MHVSADILREPGRAEFSLSERDRPFPALVRGPREARRRGPERLRERILPLHLERAHHRPEETGESTTSPDTTRAVRPGRRPAQAPRLSNRGAPARLRSVPCDRWSLPTLTWKRSSELGTPFSSSDRHEPDRHARLPHLMTGQARRADETIAVGEERSATSTRGAARRGGEHRPAREQLRAPAAPVGEGVLAVCTVSTASKQSRDGLQAANSGCSSTTPRKEMWRSAASDAGTGR